MVGIAQQAGVRTVGFGCGLLIAAFAIVLCCPLSPVSASPPGELAGLSPGVQPLSPGVRPPSAASGMAGVSVINGRPTSIDQWPWQVALLIGGKRARAKGSPLSRYFCSGSLIAPDLVLTAGHCIAGQSRARVRSIEVVSGRSRLNRESAGVTSTIRRAILPVNANGKRRFGEAGGVPSWDVALLQLKVPLTSSTIRIAGPDESWTSRPGRPVYATGWGVTGPANRRASNSLRSARQVMLPNRLCRSTTGRFYDAVTMNCLGGPGGHSSTCFGDSGGPLVAAVGDEFRLVGLTSNGDPYCRPYIPSVDARLADGPLRGWIRTTALAVSGTDVIGRGGAATPAPKWCRVPELRNLTLRQARNLLRERGCRLGRTRPDPFAGLRRGRVTFSGILPGWFATPNARIDVWVAR